MKFIAARNYTRVTQPARKIDVVVIHTMEYPERPESAEWCANYFASRTAPKASAHYCIDANSEVQCVRDEDVAWAAPGCNHNGLQLEHAGTAKQTSKDWSDEYSQAMLARSAALTARLCRRHGIPVRSLQAAGLKKGLRGITTHAAVSEAFKKSSHWDPGPAFPMSQYLQLVKDALAKSEPKPKPPPPVEPPVVSNTTTGVFGPPFYTTTSTGSNFRIDVTAGNVVLKDQDPSKPEVQGRLRKLFARFPSVSITWKRK